MAKKTALEMISITINLNVVELIQIGSNFGHKVVLGLAVVRLHIILINMIVAMDPWKILELVSMVNKQLDFLKRRLLYKFILDTENMISLVLVGQLNSKLYQFIFLQINVNE